MAVVILGSVLLLLFLPADALAWGVGVHLQLGSQILANLERLAPELRTLLAAFPHDFLYGCVSADITLGKKFTHYLRHCHSWRMGEKILAGAESDGERACAYGYLVHLAADTIAHSYFIPYKMVRTFNTTLLKHTYWEMRMEGEIAPEIWPLARTIARKDFAANDALMRRILSDTIFSFNTNKRIFNSLLLLNRLRHWQKMLRSLSRASRWTLDEKDRDDYLVLAGQATRSILVHGATSPFRLADPTGERALHAAELIRKNLNFLWLEGKLPAPEAQTILAELKPKFRQGITQPDRLLELLSGYDP